SESPAVVKALLDAGANLEAKDQTGQTARDLIRENDDLRGTDVYRLLTRR
ncbi:hypothetical protein FLM9_1059, partial [Candidatus Synechococcus spongiarum]